MADPLEIIAEIDALTVHCRAPLMDVEQRGRWQRDWAQDLDKYPIEIVRQAFREWRQGEHQKFPTPGQILPVLERLSRRSEPMDAHDGQEWRYDLSDEDYRVLSLHGKIRHHVIAAAHCRRKAGPMPHKGAPVRKADMPREWQDWIERAERHHAEANRLKQSIGAMDQRA